MCLRVFRFDLLVPAVPLLAVAHAVVDVVYLSISSFMFTFSWWCFFAYFNFLYINCMSFTEEDLLMPLILTEGADGARLGLIVIMIVELSTGEGYRI